MNGLILILIFLDKHQLQYIQKLLKKYFIIYIPNILLKKQNHKHIVLIVKCIYQIDMYLELVLIVNLRMPEEINVIHALNYLTQLN